MKADIKSYLQLLVDNHEQIQQAPKNALIYLEDGVYLGVSWGLCINAQYYVAGQGGEELKVFLTEYTRDSRKIDNSRIAYPFGEGSCETRGILYGLCEQKYDLSPYGQERWAFIEWVLNQTEEPLR